MNRWMTAYIALALASIGVLLPEPTPAQDIATHLVVSPTPPQLGGEIDVEVLMDLSSTTERLGSYFAVLNWDFDVLELMEVTDSQSPEFDIPVQISHEGPYPSYPYSFTSLKFANFSTQGIPGSASLIKAKFKVVGRSSQVPNIKVTFWEVNAAGTFTDILPLVEGFTTFNNIPLAEKEFEILPIGNENAVVKLDPKMDYWGVGPEERRHLLFSATNMMNVQKVRVTVEASLSESFSSDSLPDTF